MSETLLPRNASPTELAEFILETTTPLADTCGKLADNLLGTQSGREQAGLTRAALAACESAIRQTVGQFLQETQTLSSGHGLGKGGSDSYTNGKGQ